MLGSYVNYLPIITSANVPQLVDNLQIPHDQVLSSSTTLHWLESISLEWCGDLSFSAKSSSRAFGNVLRNNLVLLIRLDIGLHCIHLMPPITKAVTFSRKFCSFSLGAESKLCKSAGLTKVLCTACVESLPFVPSTVPSACSMFSKPLLLSDKSPRLTEIARLWLLVQPNHFHWIVSKSYR
jgi:hypothetical protein